MPGDFTRFTFDPLHDYTGVRLQQGRVLLDADLVEVVDIVDHRLRALALDVLGPCTAPVDRAAGATGTASGFRIEPAGSSFTVGLGRLWLHGTVLDCHGRPPYAVEPGLGDPRGAAPVPYEEQPWLPEPPPVPAGRHVVYVDAWDREVTAVEEPDLVDPAVGVDTSARTQTVWQVKVLDADADGVTCETADADVPGWAEATAPSAARLSTAAVGVPVAEDPCSVPPTGGYRGWDNRLYRVQVHEGGTLADATFLWSRDNASVATAVTVADSTRTVLTVTRTGRDDVQRLRVGAWVEVVDDRCELLGLPGHLAEVDEVDDVDDMAQTVTLATAVPADFGVLGPERRTRVRQWDTASADGTLRTADATGGLELELGVQVTFAEASPGGPFRTGDHWVFAARAADASVELLDAAPPRGPRHVYGRLAVLDLPTVTDCRTVWPDPGGEDCGDCTVCVTPESHASGGLTVQRAVDTARRGGTVCLAPGRYELTAPLTITRAQGLTVRGQRWASVLSFAGAGPAVVVQSSAGVSLLDLVVLLSDGRSDEGAGSGTSPAGEPVRDEREQPDGEDGEAPREPVREVVRETDEPRLTTTVGTKAEARALRTAKRGSSSKAAQAARQAWKEGVVGIAAGQVVGLTLDRCAVVDAGLAGAAGRLGAGLLGASALRDADTLKAVAGRRTTATALGLTGVVARLRVRDCLLAADLGIAPFHSVLPVAGVPQVMTAVVQPRRYLMLADTAVSDSVVVGVRAGLWLDEATVLTVGTTVERSVVAALGGTAVRCDASALESSTTIRSCVVTGRVSAVKASTAGLRIDACRLTSSGSGPTGGVDHNRLTNGDGVHLDAPDAEGVVRDVVVRDCVVDAARYGVLLDDEVEQVTVAASRLRAGLGGLVVHPETTGSSVVVHDCDVVVTGAQVPDEQSTRLAAVWLVGVEAAEVRDTRVLEVGRGSGRPLLRFGVVAESCPSAVLRGNTISGVAGTGRSGASAGIASWGAPGRLDVLDNVVSVDTSGAVAPAVDLVDFVPILVARRLDGGGGVKAAATGDAAGEVVGVDTATNTFLANDRVFTYDANDHFRIDGTPATMAQFEQALATGDTVTVAYSADPSAASTFDITKRSATGGRVTRGRTPQGTAATLPAFPLLDAVTRPAVVLSDAVLVVTPFGVVQRAVTRDSATSVRGNRIDTHGLRPAVSIAVEGPLLLNDNQVRHAGLDARQGIATPVVVQARAESAVVSANHLEGAAQLAVRLTTERRRAAVIGNAHRGALEVDGAVLGPPWADVNVQL